MWNPFNRNPDNAAGTALAANTNLTRLSENPTQNPPTEFSSLHNQFEIAHGSLLPSTDLLNERVGDGGRNTDVSPQLGQVNATAKRENDGETYLCKWEGSKEWATAQLQAKDKEDVRLREEDAIQCKESKSATPQHLQLDPHDDDLANAEVSAETSSSESPSTPGSVGDWNSTNFSTLPGFSVIFHKVFNAYLTYRGGIEETEGTTNRTSGKQKASRESMTASRPLMGKRQRNDESKEVMNGESSTAGSSKRRKRLDETPMLLACPFWKKDSIQHRACYGKILKKINRVKQHLNICHGPLWLCQRCGEEFETEERLSFHISDDPKCPKRTVTNHNLTHTQSNLLSKKSDCRLTEYEQWFAIWDIVFPGVEHPASPYFDPGLSEDINRFRELLTNPSNGPTILARVLQDSNIPGMSNASQDAYLQAILIAGCELIFDEWHSTCNTNAAPNSTLEPMGTDKIPAEECSRSIPEGNLDPTNETSMAPLIETSLAEGLYAYPEGENRINTPILPIRDQDLSARQESVNWDSWQDELLNYEAYDRSADISFHFP